MDNREILEGIGKYKDAFYSNVVSAYKERGSRFGSERFSSWRSRFESFLDTCLPGEASNLRMKLHKIMLVCRTGESDFDAFWREDGEIVESFHCRPID